MPPAKTKPAAKKKQKKTTKAPARKRAAAPAPKPDEIEGGKDAPVSAAETRRSKRPLVRAAVAVVGLGIAVKRLLRKR